MRWSHSAGKVSGEVASELCHWSGLKLEFIAVFPVVMYGCKSWTIKKAEH